MQVHLTDQFPDTPVEQFLDHDPIDYRVTISVAFIDHRDIQEGAVGCAIPGGLIFRNVQCFDRDGKRKNIDQKEEKKEQKSFHLEEKTISIEVRRRQHTEEELTMRKIRNKLQPRCL